MVLFSHLKNPAVAVAAAVCLEEECHHSLQNRYRLQEQDQHQAEVVVHLSHHQHHLILLQEERLHYQEDNLLLLLIAQDHQHQAVRDHQLRHHHVLDLLLLRLHPQADLDLLLLHLHLQQVQEAIQKMVGPFVLLTNYLLLLVLVDQQKVFQVVEVVDF